MDEMNVPVNLLQKMINEHCYQYMRSTTPVSLYPAVYYAHLASNRARAHENKPASDGPRGGQKFEETRYPAALAAAAGNAPSQSDVSNPTTVEPLVPFGTFIQQTRPDDVTKIRTGMWYI